MMQVIFGTTVWVAPTLIAVVTLLIAALVVVAAFDHRANGPDWDSRSEPLSERINRGEADLEEFERRKLAAR